MLFSVPAGLSTWEAVAADLLAKSLDSKVRIYSTDGPASEAEDILCLQWGGGLVLGEPVELNFDAAYRKVEASKEYYGVTLAAVNGLEYKVQRPLLSDVSSETGGIIICPEPLKREMALPIAMWSAIIRHLRSYGVPVYYMGDRGNRPNGGLLYVENDILSDLPVAKKIEYLANARCIVGTPNAWLWLSTAWSKKTMVFYPDFIPEKRWWPFVHENMRMFLYSTHSLQIPIFLTYIRKIMREF